MRIGINTRLFVKGKMDGIAWYAYEVVRRMVRDHPEHEFVFFCDRPCDKEYLFGENVRPVVLHPQARHPLLWWWWFGISLRKALKKERIDVFFSPDGFVCLHTHVPTVNIIHDINFEHFPKFLRFSHRIYYRHFFPKYARKADTLATVSAFCRDDIARTYHVPAGKIRVIGNAAAEDFFPLSAEEAAAVREQWTGGRPYFVFVGTINARKNIPNQLLAYEEFRKRGHDAMLLFAGSKRHWSHEMEHCLRRMRYAGDVLFTGYIPTETLNRLLASAEGLLYVSSFEGFGVPILEAFATHTPVITADITAMPEVAGDAAILVPPEDPKRITDAMETVFTQKETAKALIQKGIERLNSFSWEQSAELIWEALCPKTSEKKARTQ
ncbi:MAG: glycosyltransferase family 4 protein [Bacteroidales bacterium]|nr:glycosyltransferase family 4 protein [Bacteroidales bacterium]